MRLSVISANLAAMAGMERAQGDRWNSSRDPVREREHREHKRDDATVLEHLLRGIEPRPGRGSTNGDFPTARSR